MHIIAAQTLLQLYCSFDLTIQEEVNNLTTLANVCLTVCFSQENLLNMGPGLITESVLFGLLGN